MSSPPSVPCGVCQSTFGPSDCVHFDGDGSKKRPWTPVPTLSDAAGNLLECGPNGFGAFLPPYLLDPPAVHVYSTIDQTIPYNSLHGLFFNEERYDTDTMHDNQQETSRLVFKTPGVYLVTLNLRWKKKTVDSGDWAAFIRRNGAEFLADDSMPIADADLYGSHSLSVEDDFETDDYVEALVQQDAIRDDTPRTGTITAERQSPIFAAVFLRPLP